MGRAKKTEKEIRLNEEIGARLIRIRTDKRWSQADLAHRLGISPAQLNGLENGRYSFSAALILDLARTLGEPVTALLAADPPHVKDADEWARLYEALSHRDRLVLVDLGKRLADWSRTIDRPHAPRPDDSSGRLISLEGIDGVLLREVGEKLEKLDLRRNRVVHCWYDHGSPLWQYMMQRSEAMDDADPHRVLERTLLFACERLYRQQTAVRPALAAGCKVFTPFYTMAPTVYQEMEGVGDTRFIHIIESMLYKPDLIIVVRSDPAIAARRAVRGRPGEGQFYSPYGVRDLARALALYEGAIQEFGARGFEVRAIDVKGESVTNDLIEAVSRMTSPMMSTGTA
jgi:transcriptional regulator with XRE-family HTH domain